MKFSPEEQKRRGELIEKALSFMKEGHRSINQRRKLTDEPYEVHPLSVYAYVAEVTDDINVIIASILHDLVEDVAPWNPNFNLEVIRRWFGVEVAQLVSEVTNVYTSEAYPNFKRGERKQLEHNRLSNISDGAKLIKLADVIDITDRLDEQLSDMKEWKWARTLLMEKAHLIPLIAQGSSHLADEATDSVQKALMNVLAHIPLDIQK